MHLGRVAVKVVDAGQNFGVLVRYRLLAGMHCVVVIVTILRLRRFSYERLSHSSRYSLFAIFLLVCR